MKLSSKKLSGGAIGLLLLAVILVAGNFVVAQLRLNADLTADRLYTLSDGTRRILSQLDMPVTLKYFFSRSSGDIDVFIKTYATQVENLLREYVRTSGGKVTLEIYDPAPDSDAEEWAQQYRIEPQMLGMDVPPMYFGLYAVSADGETEQTIPGFSPRTEQTLEYDLTSLISRVANPAKPVVGVMSELPALGRERDPMAAMMGQPQQPMPAWYAFQELKRNAEVRAVAPDSAEIPSEIKTLILVHPKNLADTTLYALDQFVMRGGRLLVFVDSFSLFEARTTQQNQMMMMGGPSFSSSLDKLFEAWGISFDSERIIADMRFPTPLQGPTGPEENPTFLLLTKEAFSDDVLISQWGNLVLPFASAFTFAPKDGLTFTPLLQSSTSAGFVDPMSAQMGAQLVRTQFRADGQRHTIAARLSGTFKSAFPDGAPKADDAEDDGDAEKTAPSTAPHLASGESAILLFGDSDMLQDDVCVRVNQMFGFSLPQYISDNIFLLLSAVEQASGDSALISIRARGRTIRTYTVVDELEKKAQMSYLEKERDIESKLSETRAKLRELQSQKTPGQERAILSPAQRDTIARFRQEEIKFKKELKEVRRNLSREIKSLGARVKLLNILAVPLLVGIAGIIRISRTRI